MDWQHKSTKRSLPGVSLVEVLIVIGVFLILLSTSDAAYTTVSARHNLEIATVSVVESLRSAQVRSTQGEGDAPWGVRLVSGGLTVFRGASYATRHLASDETLALPRGIVSGGTSEIVFAPLTGVVTPGSLSLTNSVGTRTITFNEKGTLSY